MNYQFQNIESGQNTIAQPDLAARKNFEQEINSVFPSMENL